MSDEAGSYAGGEAGDAELLRAVADGDREALQELFRRHEPWLAARLSGRCGDMSLVDEAISETFLAVWRRPRAWRGEGEIAGVSEAQTRFLHLAEASGEAERAKKGA